MFVWELVLVIAISGALFYGIDIWISERRVDSIINHFERSIQKHRAELDVLTMKHDELRFKVSDLQDRLKKLVRPKRKYMRKQQEKEESSAFKINLPKDL